MRGMEGRALLGEFFQRQNLYVFAFGVSKVYPFFNALAKHARAKDR
ncbi:hypothetical protein QFZ81_001084 [Paenibacillus sp. V4I9]|nr:hypothetical protein [Paenibacillus sp. V4I9]